MAETIDKLRLLKKLDSMFPVGSDSREYYNNYSEEEYLTLLESLKKNIDLNKHDNRFSILNFLYTGCLKFDRFNIPTPFVYEINKQRYFDDFIKEFIKSVHHDPTNTAIFSLRAVRNRVYSEFDSIPINNIENQVIDSIKSEVENISSPVQPEKLKEFQDDKYKILSILDGILDRSLRTSIKTRIPFVIHSSPLILDLKWNGLNICLKTQPIFTKTENSFVSTNAAIQQKAPSRWNSGYTNIHLCFEALIDCDLYAQPLQAIHKEKSPVNGWPKCFNIAFEIIKKVAWSLRLKHGGLTQWVPAPTDIFDIEWCFHSSNNPQIEWKKKSSPSVLMQLFTPSDVPLSIDLGEIKEPNWSEQCRIFSIMYFEMGQKEEALFWLNVGVEALFEEQIPLIAEYSGLSTLEDDLKSPKAFWLEAEETISNQYPELKGKISWPPDKVHVSIFAKLKYLYKAVDMATTHRDLIKHYSKIQQFRNDLFHGRVNSVVTVDNVTIGIDSFDWIKDNFKLRE
ncbi:hypothetical protein GCM10008107_11380 [Psychrosphaera saromensis]|uniref:Uncharacterized protein n=1 Tax=Psychrosphaera saromensis TaxID=716813 RepID=A0A2S7UUG5_9GAMM|nr:hypothetical protein [Psychrosphaera saromensis]PQJ53597.1 hypothetical protein BTO11_07900 [Psychrosphaera saromensis]GHB63972.1 hypothetical protein GCM10008107_11380 [Psychrosphaera saromensis]GLQ15641.1 hypothetical protein GCM10007917_30960 [Psychrosphaera saromensis]